MLICQRVCLVVDCSKHIFVGSSSHVSGFVIFGAIILWLVDIPISVDGVLILMIQFMFVLRSKIPKELGTKSCQTCSSHYSNMYMYQV